MSEAADRFRRQDLLLMLTSTTARLSVGAMNSRGTIVDLTRWAEACMPGEESRARSVIVTIRKAGLWSYGKAGPRGRSAAFMKVTDFPTAICAVLHHGAATKADEAVQKMWNLRLSLIEVDRVDDGPIQIEPDNAHYFRDALSPYLALFALEEGINQMNDHPAMRVGSSLIGVMTSLFTMFAAHHDFGPYDKVELETAGDRIAVTIHLHGPKHGAQPDGWPGEGVEAGALRLTFGDIHVYDRLAVRTTRTLWSESLNDLSLMLPNLTKSTD